LRDIHANRQAFAACLDAARACGAQRMILLGDYVGYGADPEWTVETVRAWSTAAPSPCAATMKRHRHNKRNHERRSASRDRMTRGRLSAAQRQFSRCSAAGA